MISTFIMKIVPGSITPVLDDDGNPTNSYAYPGASSITYDMTYNDGADWEVWIMNADDEFEAQPGDTILGGWGADDGVNLPAYPIHPDLFTYVQPIGNTLNATTGTFDGTAEFPVHKYYLGHEPRWWGVDNQAPDLNQTRHVVCTRFESEFSGQIYHRVRFTLKEPFDKNNAPNALAILVYTDPERLNYYYTPGAFIWDGAEWSCETPLGQSSIGVEAPVYYCVGLGSAPLNGGGTVPVGSGHESYNWSENL